MRIFFVDVGEARNAKLLGLLRFRRNFDRVNIFSWIFLSAVVLFILGVGFSFMRGFAWVGGFVVLVYLAVFVTYIWMKLK